MELLNASMFLSHFSLGSLSRQEPMLPQMPHTFQSVSPIIPLETAADQSPMTERDHR